MNLLHIKSISVTDYRIDIRYEVTGEWQRYFMERDFFAEYSEKLAGLPVSLAVIPFLANVIPVAWYHDGEIVVDELDSEFYACLPEVLLGYRNMYPDIEFKGAVTAKKLVHNNREQAAPTCGVFFSGGVDSQYTFLKHLNEAPHLFTIWGADIRLDDTEGWKQVEQHTKQVAEQYQLPCYSIRSNFRTIVNEAALSGALLHEGWGWWHEFQHGIGIISMAAPVTYVRGIEKIYIASTCTVDKGDFTCASDPTIDNFVRFHTCHIVHDAYEVSRQDKVHFLVDFAEKNNTRVMLRVCWESTGGENCGVCEKCCRTITAIYLEDGNPADFGFASGKETEFAAVAKRLRRQIHLEYAAVCYWENLHERFQDKYTPDSCPRAWRWFYRGGVEAINSNMAFRMHCGFARIKRKIRRLLKAVFARGQA